MIGLEDGGRPVAGSSKKEVRERALQAVHYYNSNVAKVRNAQNIALSRPPTYCYQKSRNSKVSVSRHENLYRSNSSLELLHDNSSGYRVTPDPNANLVNTSVLLKREYGSHGSIDVISSSSDAADMARTSEQFFAMLRDYKPAVLDLADGPLKNRRKETPQPNGLPEDYVYANKVASVTSPKQKLKITKFWGNKSLSLDSAHHESANCLVSSTHTVTSNSPELDEKQRRRAFGHYDCQSIAAKLGHGNALLRDLLLKKRNTTTGASAASVRPSYTPDGDSEDDDNGDGRSNDLVESCPFFRNEIGGEEERVVSLTRSYTPLYCCKQWTDPCHKPALSCCISILEFSNSETHWKSDACPYRRNYKCIENVDEGALYYRNYFYAQDHQNWFGLDENLGPVAISIKKEKVDLTTETDASAHLFLYRYRLIVRTSELQTLRGSILEDAIPNVKPSHINKNFNAKEVLEYVVPEVRLSCLRLGVHSSDIEEQLLKLDEQSLTRHYKVGILYCRAGQSTEEEMYNNEDGGPAFNEFLETIGQKVRLKGFEKFRAGLDNKTDSTGLYSVYSKYQECEIMFHVSTLLPFTPNNRQQLLRKRHIGNDIVTIVFQEPDAQPFTPKNIRSQFQHVFIVVQAIHPCSDRTQYSVAVTRSKDVPLFGPPIPKGAIFNKSKNFADFLLAKVINAENAAHRSEKFAAMATRTRQAYLKDLTINCATSTVLETSQKFSVLSFSSKKKERWKPRFVPDAVQKGAICWQVMLEDSTQSTIIHCYLAISADSIVLIDESTSSILFVTPCKSVLGWSAQSNSLRLYYHEGECVTVHMRESSDRDELMEVVTRLRSVTNGVPAQELSLKRNSSGQLGFHVQPDGAVTQVENMGLAWQAGLRQGYRLVEICKVAVTTLSHDQMVDLLKTSLMVTVTVIPSLPDGSPRRGCTLQNCRYSCLRSESGPDNNVENQRINAQSSAALQQIGNHKKMYERNLSPPRSCNSSGYGTGSSSKSFSGLENKAGLNASNDLLLTSLSSSNSDEQRWYDMLDVETLPNEQISLLATNNVPKQNCKNPPHAKVQGSHSLPFVNTTFSYALTTEQSSAVMPPEVNNRGSKTDHRIDEMQSRDSIQKSGNCDSSKMSDLCGRESKKNETALRRNRHIEEQKTDRQFSPSEDELSTDSSNARAESCLPSKISHAAKIGSNSSLTGASEYSGSRNSSPRMKSETTEARLRPGASSARTSNRNSANLAGSTLQQDLMKLINPDYSPADSSTSELRQKTSKQKQTDMLALSTTKHSEDNLKLAMLEKTKSDKHRSRSTDKSKKERIDAISSHSSSSSVSSNSKDKQSVISNGKSDSLYLPLPDTKEMNWHSLVDTATKAMMHVSAEEANKTLTNAYPFLSTAQNDEPSLQKVTSIPSVGYSIAVDDHIRGTQQQEFSKYLSELENRLMKETQRRLSLEQEVHFLRDENRRLQQESQNAAQQLRKFTEWFFQTIDKRS